MSLFSPSWREVIHNLLAKGRTLDQILLPPFASEGGKIWMSPSFDEPMKELAKFM